MKLSAILLGTILFAAFSTPAQTNFAQVSFAAPTFGVTPAVAAVSPLNSVSLAEPFASSPALPPAAMPAPEPVPQGVQGVFEKYSYDVYVGYTFFRFYEVPGVESSMNGVNGSAVYWYRDWVGADGEVFAVYGSQPGQNSWLVFFGGGPRFRYVGPKGIDVWAHALVGGMFMTPETPYGGQGAIAGVVGAGVDLNGHHRHMALRFAVDGVASHFFQTYQVSPKASAGIVYKF